MQLKLTLHREDRLRRFIPANQISHRTISRLTATQLLPPAGAETQPPQRCWF